MLTMMQPCEIENQTNVTSNILNQEFPSGVVTHTPFGIGEVVDVQSRTWPGINKPGGTARVKSFDVASQSYCVTYMLGGKEDGIDAEYVKLHTDEGVRERRRAIVVNVPAPVIAMKKKKRKVLCETGNSGEKIKLKKKRIRQKKTTPVSCNTDGESSIEVSHICEGESAHEFLSRESEEEGEYEEYEEDYEEDYEEEEEEEEEAHEQQPTLSAGTLTAQSLIHEAFRACPPSGDGVFSVTEIEEYIMSKGDCSKEDVAACFTQAEEENRIMVDDGSIYVI